MGNGRVSTTVPVLKDHEGVEGPHSFTAASSNAAPLGEARPFLTVDYQIPGLTCGKLLPHKLVSGPPS